jgi:hypothetical protein
MDQAGKLLALGVLLGMAQAQTLLTFSQPGPLVADPGVEVLSYSEDSPVVLVHAGRAGEYRVCLGNECRSFIVPQVRQVEVRAEVLHPNLVLGDTLRLTLRNRGNTPLSLTVRPEGAVRFASQALTLEVGEERTLDLGLEGYGSFLVWVEGDARSFLALRRPYPDGRPDPYSLSARFRLSPKGPQFALQGPLSQLAQVRLGLSREGASFGLDLSPEWLRLSLGYEGGSFGVQGPQSGAYAQVGTEIPTEWGSAGFAVRYDAQGWSFSGSATQGEERVEASARLGATPTLDLRYIGQGIGLEGGWREGFYLGASYGGASLRVGSSGVEARLGTPVGDFTLTLGQSWRGAWYGPGAWVEVEGRDSFRVSGGLMRSLGEGVLALGVGYGPDWRVRLSYSGKGFTAYTGSQGTGLSLSGEEKGVGWGLGLTLTPTFQGQVNLEWRVPVPEEVTLALGGYPGVRPVEGGVTLEGEPLAGARVVYGEVAATTDSTGRYRIYLPEGAVARVIPPEGVLALEGSAQGGEVDLKKASALLPDCRGEVVVNGKLYPCGRLVVPPGRYTLTLKQTSLVVEVAPGEERVVEFPPPPPPPPLEEAETPLFLEIPGPLPSGGEVELLATGEKVETPWGTFAVENGRARISIPPGVSGQFTFRILGGGRSKEYSVEVR